METKDELKEIDIKNRTCYYFDDIMAVRDNDFRDISQDRKSYKNILIYDFSHKTLMGSKPLRIKFYKIDGLITTQNIRKYRFSLIHILPYKDKFVDFVLILENTGQ